MVISMPTMVEEAIKDSDEVEILESLHVSPAPVNTTYGNLLEPIQSSSVVINMYKVSGSLEIVSSSIPRIYRNCKTIGVNRKPRIKIAQLRPFIKR